MRRLTSLTTAAATVAAMAIAPAATAASSQAPAGDLQQHVKVQDAQQHLKELQRIADRNGGNRAAGSEGYDASAAYVAKRARNAGYDVTIQTFEFPFFAETAPPELAAEGVTYEPEVDFATMTYSGSGSADGAVSPVDLSLADPSASTSGCEAEDFSGFQAGTIALIQRGACSFAQKATLAEDAGAVGVIVFNQGTADRQDFFFGTLGAPGITLPVVGASFAVGEALADGGTAQLATFTESEIRETANVLAETPGTADADEVVVVGAHLDSVPEGPGINDNGTGTAGILAIAEGLSKETGRFRAGDDTLERGVRFAFWGAEEFGLLGAEHYVGSLSDDELDRILLNLNFDMIGSPNYGRFVYDGDASANLPGSATAPAGSDVIEDVLVNAFDEMGLASAPTAFSGRSDYGPFIEAGIPAGGLFTGAEGIKTEDEVSLFGGEAGVAYDVCYHAECDDIDNVNVTGLEEMLAAATASVWHFATSADPFGGVPETDNDAAGETGGGGLHEHHDDRLIA